MRQVRIQKRSRLTVALVAMMAASALLSAFQPASADVLQMGSATTTSVTQNGYRVGVGAGEGNSGFCVVVSNLRGEEHWACASGANVDVADDLAWASARGTANWSSETVTFKGNHSKTTYKTGTVTVDVTWSAIGELETIVDPHYEYCDFELYGGGCGGLSGRPYQRRQATWSATITDSEWGTFVIHQAPAWMYQGAM